MIHGLPFGPHTCVDAGSPKGVPCTKVERAVLTRDFNAAVKKNVEARVAANEPVRFVDVNSALTIDDLDSEPNNGVHPKDPCAYSKVAMKFLEAIRAALGITSSGSSLNINTSACRR
jgi:hypothetical protein